MSSVTTWLAQDPPPPAQGAEFGHSSPIALVVTLVLLIALVFLIRSMNKHLRKVPRSFEQADTSAEQPAETSPDTRAPSSGSSTTGGDPKA